MGWQNHSIESRPELVNRFARDVEIDREPATRPLEAASAGQTE